ncbi:YTH domain-containing protein ECT4 [Malania oleifera]|uniref:YTH domain-containing protein ECT4 n=1 Tax=Malania oleifera TaxID=397392 RepID=UPI0025AE1A6E|nr:YTH domain-containing protein ECT4 [Malania oleifera]
MEMYNAFEHGNTENYLIQGTESNQHLTTPVLEQVEAMYNEGAPEFVVEQGLYYPHATNYGYYCTGFESPGEWDDHHRVFGLDGLDVQYAGAQTDNLPFVYYTPSYGYAQSPYNPYNPFIPGAMIGVDGPFVGTQQYYTVPPYQNTVSSPAYFPIVAHSRPDIVPNSSTDPSLDPGASAASRAVRPSLKHNLSSASPTLSMTPQRPASNETHSLTKISEGSRANAGSSNQPVTHGSIMTGSFPNPASSHILQGRSASGSIQAIDGMPNGKVLSHRNQLKVALPFNSGLSDFGSSAHGRAPVDKLRPKYHHYGTTLNDANGNPDALNEQNRGPRTNRSKNQLSVKAYTTKVGDSNAQGNIIIYTDQYNRDDFSVDYLDAKFFVIKSYSEDDVHKSIKYNVWSSTPNGNKKLNNAYEDTQRVAAGQSRRCPVFLFFSVNASGQFCGVAEMIGPVDFQKDMDFWQQDKWSGSFPVKWHFVKDVPNANFRHIILENNENKPVTNSRDTQEIRYKQGLEMLKIFKNYTLRTSLLDDFMYYENRQKIMQEEKARLLIKSYESPFFVTTIDPPRKLSSGVDSHSREVEKISQHNDANSSENAAATATEQVSLTPHVTNMTNLTSRDENDVHVEFESKDDVSSLKIGSLTISPKQGELKHSTDTASTPSATEPVDVVTVGSMPIKVNGFAESSGFLTVGTIPLDPRALQKDKSGGFVKGGS